MLQPSVRALLTISEGARFLYFSLRGAADERGQVWKDADGLSEMCIGCLGRFEIVELLHELKRFGLVRFSELSEGWGPWHVSIEVVDYRADDPRPDWAPEVESGPPARKPALVRADRPATHRAT